MKTLSLKLPPDLDAWLVQIARRSKRSRSSIIREALEEKRTKRATALELASDLCGSGSSGLKDLATNKKYLAGFGK